MKNLQKIGLIIEEFLKETSSQLTEIGLLKLGEAVKEGEFAVFFRNNHFATITKHKGTLFLLVTDIGYERERNVVWEALAHVRGDTTYFSAEFEQTGDVKQKEVIDTALAFGFPMEKIQEAIKAIHKATEELKVDDVLAWLNKHCTPLN